MRVLIIDANPQDREAAAKYLQAAGHEVTAIADTRSALAEAEKVHHEVVVLDVLQQGPTAFQLLQYLRRKEVGSHAYIVVTSAKPTTTELTTAISAGADDYMRKPLSREELVVRVGALERIRKWASQVFSAVALDWTTSPSISKLTAWAEVDRTVSNDISELLGVSLGPMHGEDPIGSTVVAAQIPLTIAAEGMEVRLTVGLDAPSLNTVAELVLGAPGGAADEAVRDMVREFANTAAGAFKRTAGQEGVTLTCGLPVDIKPGRLAALNSTARRKFFVSAKDQAMRIGFDIEVAAKSLARVTVAALKEGMVLARDLKNDAGGLLVPAGTRLTSSQIDRMQRILSDEVAIDVAMAA